VTDIYFIINYIQNTNRKRISLTISYHN
jgi:hypothetical protein